MKKLSIALTNYIFNKGVISEEHYDIYLFGFRCFLEILLNFICSFFIATFLNMGIECILFFLFFIPLRSYNGGLHLEKYYSCLFFSCLTLTSVLLIVKYYSLELTVSFALFILSLIIIKLIGSVNHPNRPVHTEENLHFIKKSNLTIFISILAAVFFIITESKKYLLVEALVFFLVASTMLLGKFKKK